MLREGESELDSTDVQILREKFPKDLESLLNQEFEGLKWSDTLPHAMIMDSMGSRDGVSLYNFIFDRGYNVEFHTNAIVLRVGDVEFLIYGKEETCDLSRGDFKYYNNLARLREILGDGAKALNLGGGGEPLVKEFFGQNALNLDISRDFLGPGDIQADAANIPLEDSSLDLVVMREFGPWINSTVVGEVGRVLRNGGLVYFAAQNPDRLFLNDKKFNFERVLVDGIQGDHVYRVHKVD